MNKSATQFALYLHNHPEAGLQQWHLMRTLPHGMSDLLQTAASGKKRAEVANLLGMYEVDLQQAFIKFLQLVMSDYQKSPYRGLATREQSNLDTCIKHKKLLQNIFHPDKFHSDKAHQLIQQIQSSYDCVQQLQTIKENKKHAQKFTSPPSTEDVEGAETIMQFQVNNVPRQHSAYRRYEEKKQTNYILMAGIAGLALVGLLVILIVPSNPQEVVRQQIVADTSPPTSKKIILAGSTSTTPPSSPSEHYHNINDSDSSRIQILLNEFERGLEGDLIRELLSAKNPSSSSKQIMGLFASADQKKVFFHGFTWNITELGFYGEGEYLARFQFSDKNQWVTRKGKSSLALSNNDSKLLIEQFHFEDNLH